VFFSSQGLLAQGTFSCFLGWSSLLGE